jgi:AraC-like DNA-binding protein
MPQSASENSGHLRRYAVPEGLNPEQRFEHWRTWYGNAVEAPMRLEKMAHAAPVPFTPSAISLAGPGFSERIRALRTRRALELLLQADAQKITYSEIAASCGFTNIQSMRRAVKEFTGMNVREIHRSETDVRVALQQLRESLNP